ncbi:glutamate formimidoyltransferase [Deltaproteobacteria bacterium OttesenSCG-928-K17]|nr:glutamate formimidoyltransferase [Deltaproteobacteria bacterium OttesenSCG-928-K17]
MTRIVECIPNFSEGRNHDVIEALVKEAQSVPGVSLLDNSSDAAHNRSVFTLTGDPEGIAEAAFRLCKLAGEKIDMTKHQGEHPRMGATDVIPFVPIRDVSLEECVDISKKLAERIWRELAIPSFLYEESAQSEGRRNLAALRKGQFEGMAEKLLLDEWAPDFGERKIHPTAGITAIGARMPLIAFNVNLNTADVAIADSIARVVRAAGGGYKHCRAIGVSLGGRNIVQVSMNLVNYEVTPVYRVFETIRFEARRWGVEIIGSELIGLTPAKALIDCAEYYLRMEGFDYKKQVLENHLLK